MKNTLIDNLYKNKYVDRPVGDFSSEDEFSPSILDRERNPEEAFIYKDILSKIVDSLDETQSTLLFELIYRTSYDSELLVDYKRVPSHSLYLISRNLGWGIRKCRRVLYEIRRIVYEILKEDYHLKESSIRA